MASIINKVCQPKNTSVKIITYLILITIIYNGTTKSGGRGRVEVQYEDLPYIYMKICPIFWESEISQKYLKKKYLKTFCGRLWWTSQKFIFTISTFMSYTPLLMYNPHTDCTILYLNQRFRHIFIDFPPLTPDALEPSKSISVPTLSYDISHINIHILY